MNTVDLSLWGQFFARLGIGLCSVMAIAYIAHTFLKSSSWRRAIWQIALMCSLLLVAIEVTGVQKGFGIWLFGKPIPERIVTAKVFDPLPTETSITSEPAAIAPSVPLPLESIQLPKNCWWPAILWLTGGALVLIRILFAQGVFMAFRSKRKQLSHPALLSEIQTLSGQLKVGRAVKVYELHRVSGPIAFGVARPSIGIPKGFHEQFTRSQQQAMLAHELAHLRSWDPLWYLLANIATALFWWHPGVWWMRRQLHVASEFAADEAVLLLKNGPVTLAECLLTFGRQLTGDRPLDALGVGGFRSNLGKRVEALLNLDESSVRISKGWQQTVVKVVAPICLMAALVCTVGWFENRDLQKGSDFESTVQDSWGGSIAAITFSAAREEREIRSFLAAEKNASPKNEEAPIAAGSRAAQTFRRLEEHRVPELELQKTPLEEALKLLGAAIGNRGNVPYVVAVTNEVLITAAVSNVSMQSALNAFVAGATKPIAYSVDSRGILTIKDAKRSGAATYPNSVSIGRDRIDPESGEPLVTHVFQVDGAALMKRVAAAGFTSEPEKVGTSFNIPRTIGDIPNVQRGEDLRPIPIVTAAGARSSTGLDFVTKTNELRSNNELLRRSFSNAGIEIDIPKSLFLNDRSGELIVRASVDEIKRIGGVLEVLASPKTTDPANQEKARLLAEEGESLYKARKFDLARSKLFEALQLDPKSSAARYYLQLIERRDALPKSNDGLMHPTMPPKEVAPVIRGSQSSTSPMSDPVKKLQGVDPRFSTNEPSQLQTRTYKVDVTAMEASLAKLRSEAKNSSGKTQNELLRDFFAETGVEINVPKALFYNDATGLLIVRANEEDHGTVEQGVVFLNTTRPQVMIEAKFAEVDRELFNTSGGELFMGSKVVNSSLVKRKSLPVGVGSKDPADIDLSINGFTPTNAVESTFEGILSPKDFRSLIQNLEETSGADVLSSPKVTTLSGRQAQISVLDIRTIVTGLETVKAADGAFSSEFKTQPLEFGPTLDVIPEVSVDNSSVKMTVIATLREFLGYEEPHRTLRKVSEVEGQLPLPKMRVRQITTAAEVPDGHTLVLGGLISDRVQRTKHILPLLGRADSVGRLSRVERIKTEKRHLTVFVTPTIINNAGRPVNKK